MNKWVKVFGFCILFALSLWSCDTTEPLPEEPRIFASALNNEVSLLVKDYGGRDITSLTLANRKLHFWDEWEPLPFIAHHKGTWTFLVPSPRYSKGQGPLRNGEYITSNIYVSSPRNRIRLRCIFLYEEAIELKKGETVFGGSSLNLVRIETEAGEVVSESIEPGGKNLLQVRLKGNVVSIIK